MSVYNGEKYIAEAIESILGQTFSDFEFIIVDDGSRDRSSDIVLSYLAQDSRIRFYKLEDNVGKAAAWNYAIDASTGEYITRMDCDDVSLPERLQKQVRHLQSHPNIGALGTFTVVVDEELRPLFDWPLSRHHASIAYNMFLGESVHDASVMMRRGLLTACGGYDPALSRGAGIEIISRTIWRTRYANLPEPLYLYRMHEAHQFDVPQRKKLWAELLKRLLLGLWGEAPQASLKRFAQVRRREKLSWQERRLAKRDLMRLIDSMVAANWINDDDRAYLIHVLNGQLEHTTPRLWQMFCHWRRHHFGRRERT